MMLTADKREEVPPVPDTSDERSHPTPPKRARVDSPDATSTPSAFNSPDDAAAAPQPDVIAAASSAARCDMQQPSPYTYLQHAVHNALENKATLTTSDKVALALEVLRARQLELDLAQARNNIEALVTKTGSAPRTLRSVIPASSVKGLPVSTPVEISRGKFLLSPTTNDPQALFLTLELQSFGERGEASTPNASDNVNAGAASAAGEADVLDVSVGATEGTNTGGNVTSVPGAPLGDEIKEKVVEDKAS